MADSGTMVSWRVETEEPVEPPALPVVVMELAAWFSTAWTPRLAAVDVLDVAAPAVVVSLDVPAPEAVVGVDRLEAPPEPVVAAAADVAAAASDVAAAVAWVLEILPAVET